MIAKAKTFTWITGEPVAYTGWRPGQPNDNGGNEDCGLAGALAGDWTDDTCTKAYPFVCELD